MSKQTVGFRVPEQRVDELDKIQEQHGYEDRSDAARRVLQKGIQTELGRTDGGARVQSGGEQLGQQATSVAVVGSVVALIAAGLGAPWATALVVPFGLATLVFSLIWASVRVLEGRELL